MSLLLTLSSSLQLADRSTSHTASTFPMFQSESIRYLEAWSKSTDNALRPIRDFVLAAKRTNWYPWSPLSSLVVGQEYSWARLVSAMTLLPAQPLCISLVGSETLRGQTFRICSESYYKRIANGGVIV